MRWIVPVVVLVLMACGGPQVPTHSGYKSDKLKPWKKPKVLAFDEKGETKTEGDLSYPDMKRAKWFAIDLPANGELSLRLEITPPGDATNDEFDLAMEVLDEGFRVIAKSDLEEQDAGELTKSKTLLDLAPGRYLVHLYLQGRMDTADFVLRGSWKRTAPAEVKSNFPSEVDFVPALAMVPLTDDTPKNYRPQVTVVKTTKTPRTTKREPKPEAAPALEKVTARVLGLSVAENGYTEITIGRGVQSKPPAADGMKAAVSGVSGTVPIERCTERTCKAKVKATPDQITKAGGSVVLTP